MRDRVRKCLKLCSYSVFFVMILNLYKISILRMFYILIHYIVIYLRIAHYFEACKVKRQQWLQVIGNITFEQAFNRNESVFEHMIGRHSHGLNHEQFWAMALAAKSDPAKRAIFIRKSNNTVAGCFNKV